MRTRIILFLVALALVMAGCSSSDPTESNEYAELEQELAQSETQLTQVAAERNALAEEVAAVPAAITPNTVPGEIAALTTAWGEAINRDDGSVTDLYRNGGYHLYGARRIPLDNIASHLEAGTAGEWLTEPYLLVDEGDGRYVVARGARVNSAYEGSITFSIARSSDGELEIVKTAWFHANL